METQCFYEEDKRLLRIKRYGGTLSQSFTDQFYPIQNQLCQMSMHYVLSLNSENLIVDVSSRYMKDISYRWFNRLDLRTDLGKAALLLQSLLHIFNRMKCYTTYDYKELDNLMQMAMINYTIPETFTAMKNSPNFITPSTLRYNEVIMPDTKPVKRIKINNKRNRFISKIVYLLGNLNSSGSFLGVQLNLIKPHKAC